jgi:major membrane immunogen (membrane-anchored lipoprotein)
MAKVHHILLLGILLINSGCSGKDQKWEKVTPADGSFTIEMPAKPQPANLEVPVPQGKIKMTIYELVMENANYTAGYSDYPEGFLATMGSNPEEILSSASNATINKLKAQLIKDEKLTINNFPASIVVTEFNAPEGGFRAVMKQVSVLANGRMYIVQSIINKSKETELADEVKRFHDSFQLIK